MSEKILNSRIVHKHDVEANWLKAVNFIPKQGEIIVYDIDDTYNYERFKIGDGKTLVSALPFADDALRASLLAEIGAVDDKVDAVSSLVGDTAVSEQITAAIADKADSDHVHDVATSDANGFMSSADKTFIDKLDASIASIGYFSSKTVAEFREALVAWTDTVCGVPGAKTWFSCDLPNLVELWNGGDTTSVIGAGTTNVIEVNSSYSTSDYLLLKITSYSDSTVYYVACANGTWANIRKVAFTNNTVASTQKLATARKINGVSFDGTSDITITADPAANQLTGGDLNNVRTPGYYFAGGSSGVTNIPDGVDAFGVEVYRSAGGYITQELTSGNQLTGKKFVRTYNNSTWSEWEVIYTSAYPQVHVGPTQPTDPNVQVWINTSEDGTGVVPVLPRITTISLPVANWTGSAAPYYQTVSVNTVTSATKIDLQPTVAQITSLQNDDIALMAENTNGVVKIYSFGGKPSADMTMQVLLTEVSYV